MENFTILIDHREDGVFLRCLSFLIYLNNYAEASLTIKDTYNKRFSGSIGQGGQTNIDYRNSNTDVGCILTMQYTIIGKNSICL